MDTKNLFSKARVVGAGVDPDEYHKEDKQRGASLYVMTRSALQEFSRCPSRWISGYTSADTKATEWGTLVDCVALTPEQFDKRIAVCPATYPATPKKKGDPVEQKPWNSTATYCSNWEETEEAAGRLVVKHKKAMEARTAVKFLMDDKRSAAFIKASAKQVMVEGVYTDKLHGIEVAVKALIDLVPHKDSEFKNSLGDLKTAASASRRAWVKAVFEHGYDWQAAWNLDLYNAATAEGRSDVRHVIQENYAPWQTGRRILSAEFIQMGRAKYQLAMAKYCACLVSNEWPDHDANGWGLTEPEPWMLERLGEEEFGVTL